MEGAKGVTGWARFSSHLIVSRRCIDILSVYYANPGETSTKPLKNIPKGDEDKDFHRFMQEIQRNPSILFVAKLQKW